MSWGSNFRKMYFILPLAFILNSCSLTKNMVFVNGPKDLEYKVNAGNVSVEQVRNIQEGINSAYKDFENRCIPYNSLVMGNRPYIPKNSYLDIPK